MITVLTTDHAVTTTLTEQVKILTGQAHKNLDHLEKEFLTFMKDIQTFS